MIGNPMGTSIEDRAALLAALGWTGRRTGVSPTGAPIGALAGGVTPRLVQKMTARAACYVLAVTRSI